MAHIGPKILIPSDHIAGKIPENSTLIVGFSGGPDSVYLLHLLAHLKEKLNLNIIAAHLDHGWRPESHQDADWCKQVCDSMNIAIVVQKASLLAYQPKYNGSKEDIGRKLRRYFFQSLAQKYQAHAIVLAHHQDDQIETFFIRLLRGSSVTGLSGIKPHDGLYLRPLLNIPKQQILEYLHDHAIPFLVDSSNQSDAFLRNRIRNQLIPSLQNIDPRWSQTIPKSIAQLQQADHFLESYTIKTLESISPSTSPRKVRVHDFLAQDTIVQHRMLLKMLIEQQISFTPSNALFAEIVRFLHSKKHHKHVLTGTNVLIKQRGEFYFSTL